MVTNKNVYLLIHSSCFYLGGHDLLEIKVGGIIPRDTHTLAPLPPKVGVIYLKKMGNEGKTCIEKT